MVIPTSEIEVKKKIGKLKGQDVFRIRTKGGFEMVAKGGTGEVLGAASHRAIARHIASKAHPDIEYSELSKSDHIPLDTFQHMLPEYEELTAKIRELQGY